MNHKRKLTHDKNKHVTWFGNNYGPSFGDNSLSVGIKDLMNSDGNCVGYTGGVKGDCFNTPVDVNGFSILTGMTKGGYDGGKNKDRYFTLVALETY